MFERFSDQARAVVVQAQEESGALGHSFVGTEHLLLALLHTSAGATATLLTEAGVDAPAVRELADVSPRPERAHSVPAVSGESRPPPRR